MTIVLHDLKHTMVGDAYEDCVSKAGAIQTHPELFFSRDCAVEAGYQVAEIGACVLLDLA